MSTDWKAYEEQILERIRALAGDEAAVKFDHKLPGKLSEVDRQIDIYVEGKFANRVANGTMAVDCKCWSRRIDVADVDRFVGTIEDVRTDFGLLVTTEGFSEGAERRAQNARGIKISIVPFEDLEDWEPQVEVCEFCTDFEAEHSPGFYYMDPIPEAAQPGLSSLVTAVGVCDRCQAIHMECRCGAINGASEFDQGEWHECEGGCGTEWLASIELDRKGVPLVTHAVDMIQARRRDETFPSSFET